ncbi:hypothetical protein [Nostoc sp. NMS2]|uniref:hypothetical protein n=1 Tax=Nostoc sp. NMS2 TaxID=2815389 RepID=UPI0025FA9285|nr:hypothetical protein [Nostoc sp. NMS2]
MKRNPTLSPNFMLGYAIAAPNLQNYFFVGRCINTVRLRFFDENSRSQRRDKSPSRRKTELL